MHTLYQGLTTFACGRRNVCSKEDTGLKRETGPMILYVFGLTSDGVRSNRRTRYDGVVAVITRRGMKDDSRVLGAA
jgi:hypothetical protein